MSKRTTPKRQRNPLALDLPPELRSRLKDIAENNGLNLSALTRMCIHTGFPLVEKKLKEMREPAALPA
jgi:hypothetical protein